MQLRRPLDRRSRRANPWKESRKHPTRFRWFIIFFLFAISLQFAARANQCKVMTPGLRGSTAMMVHRARRSPFSSNVLQRARVAALSATTVLGLTCGAVAQGDLHDLMEGRGRGVSFPVSCGTAIQPR